MPMIVNLLATLTQIVVTVDDKGGIAISEERCRGPKVALRYLVRIPKN
jgi:hypothetical protein